ncbi:uncharacterized protein LOC135163703 [Diachasmimorpha longicaudata]|uniref:uncharacterized protein LOC135163703 n=1 Tax=Diachasmimorpha longicaudata TaxID=58733 RepID=UPI0030B8CB6C
MALWNRKIHWQFGGNVQPVRMICEVDWKSCPFTILNYLWSETVTDVIDYVTGTDGILWRVIISVCCMLLVLYTFWSKITEIIGNIMTEYVFNGINFKLKSLEMRVNVLAYRMQYGSWPLPHIDKNSEIIRIEDRPEDLFTLDSPNSGCTRSTHECISKPHNLKLQLNDPATCDGPSNAVRNEDSVTRKSYPRRKCCNKCVKGLQSHKNLLNTKCQVREIRKSMGIQCQSSDELNDDEGQVEIPLKLLSSSPNISKLFRSTRITLNKVRQRLESLHTVLKIYRNEQGVSLTRKKTVSEVNLLDNFLQKLSDFQAGTAQSYDPPVDNISDDLVTLQKNLYTPEAEENKLIKLDGQGQCNEQFSDSLNLPGSGYSANEHNCAENEMKVMERDNAMLSGDEETIEDSGDSVLTASKKGYPSQPLDSIIEEQSGNSGNEVPPDGNEDHDNQKGEPRVNNPYKNPESNNEDKNEPGYSKNSVEDTVPSTTLQQTTSIITAEESQQSQELSNEKKNEDTRNVEMAGESDSLRVNIPQIEIKHADCVDDTDDGGCLREKNIITCPSTRTEEIIPNDSTIGRDSSCSEFMKLENIKFTALTEIENSWTTELFGDERLPYSEPLALKNSFTGINFTINVLSNEFREGIARLGDVVDPPMLNYPERINEEMKNTREPKLELVTAKNIADEGHLSLILSSTSIDSSIEGPNRKEGQSRERSDLDLSRVKRNTVKNNMSKSSTELSSRRSKSYAARRTSEMSSKRPSTPQISLNSTHRRSKINEQNRSASLDCIQREVPPKSRSKSGIPVLKSRFNDASTRRSRDRCNPVRTPSITSKTSQILTARDSSKKSITLSPNEESLTHNSEEQTIIYINIINESHNNPVKMENTEEFSDYIKENIFKIRGLTEYIKNSGVSKIVTIVCSGDSQSADSHSQEAEMISQRKFVIDTNSLV